MTEQEQATPTLLGNLFGWYAMVIVGLGLRTGLLDALLEGPGDADEIARRAEVDPRNAAEWLRGMTAAHHAVHHDGTFTLSPETAYLLGPEFPIEVRSLLAITLEMPLAFDDIAAAIRAGGGLPPETFAPLGAAASRINTPTYAAVLVREWIEGAAGAGDRLRAGGLVAELGGGNGDAAVMVAEAYPATRVVSYDIAPSVRDDLPANLTIAQADVRDLPDDGPFDLVYCLDAFHHLGDPLPVLQKVRSALAPDGVLIVAETDMSGDLDQDVQNPFSVVVYGAGLVYCLQENLHSGGVGRSGGDGVGWIRAAMSEAGFGPSTVTPSETGYAIITASPLTGL